MEEYFNENLIMTEDKVRGHCHVTGEFRGAAHESCNLSFELIKKVPVIFHNLNSYDSHLILMNLINLM